MRELTRRDALSGVAAVGVVALAGCVTEEEENGNGESGAGSGENGGTDDGTENGDDGTENGDDETENGDDGTENGGTDDGAGDEEAAILDASAETVDVDERSDDYDWATVEREADAVVVHGVLPAPTPCHEAVVESELEDGQLTVVIDVRSTLDDDEACAQVLAEVEYEARIEVTGDVETVEVEHATGETHVEE